MPLAYYQNSQTFVTYNASTETLVVSTKNKQFVGLTSTLATDQKLSLNNYLVGGPSKYPVESRLVDDADNATFSIFQNYEGLQLDSISVQLKPDGVPDHWSHLKMLAKDFKECNRERTEMGVRIEELETFVEQLVASKSEHDKDLLARVAIVLAGRAGDDYDLTKLEPVEPGVKLE